MDVRGEWGFKQPLILTLNSLCTFALNISVFLVISHTSALTIRVAGVVKDWVVVLLSALIFADTTLTPINLFGYAVGKYEYFSNQIKVVFLISEVVLFNTHLLTMRHEASRAVNYFSIFMVALLIFTSLISKMFVLFQL